MNEPILELQVELIELAEIGVESIGWQPLEQCAYLHVGDSNGPVIEVVGVPDASMVGLNLLLLGW